MGDYQKFLYQKAQLDYRAGFDPLWMPDYLYDFQQHLTEWALQNGRGAIFADCGMGKTPMQLVWAENVIRETNKPVLIACPLAVAYQTVREAEKFDIEAIRVQDGKIPAKPNIVVTNYERLHLFEPSQFSGMVCDESSILKNFDGVRRATITEFMRRLPYRLLCTATAAPNDYTELGTSSEALGHLGMMDMLERFFRNQQQNANTRIAWRARADGQWVKWRFKGHASGPFWRWVCSWARAIRKPSDYGFDNDGFILPPLEEKEHMVKARILKDGFLFDLPAVGLKEEREERRRTIKERCERVSELVDHKKQALVWCYLNDEGDRLEKLIPDAVQVSGSDSDDEKEERLLAFADGEIRCLITKPKIGAWGLNLQKCSHITFFPSHSYEQYYQGVRRCWRFGQKKTVHVDLVCTEGSKRAMESIRRKSTQADKMFTSLVQYMRDEMKIDRRNDFTEKERMPEWLQTS
jgi:superfamily II DNA or RNA helicase